MNEMPPLPPFTDSDWDKLRFLMQDSLLADTSMPKLARDLGHSWPLRGKAETPRKYLHHSLASLAEMPEFYGKGNRLQLLYQILSETISMDDPFHDMATHLDADPVATNEPGIALQDLEVSPDFPIDFANFAPDTLTLCASEKLTTLGELIGFSHRCAQTVFLGGDFQRFLNALLLRDRSALRRFLPLREATNGLFLAETLGFLTTRLSDTEAATLLRLYRLRSTRQAWNDAQPLDRKDHPDLLRILRESAHQRFHWMPDQAQQLRHALETGQDATIRFFAPIADPDVETLCLGIAKAAFDYKPSGTSFLHKIFS